MDDSRLLLTVGALLLLTVTAVTMIADTEISAEPDEWITIDSADDLARIGTGVLHEGNIWSMSAYYLQTEDIILRGQRNHVPIGSVDDPFTGRYNGYGNVITGLDVRCIGPAGMFGHVSSPADICGIILKDAHLESSGGPAGGICGVVNGSPGNRVLIEGCTVDGNVASDAQTSSAGGIAGIGDHVMMTRCSNRSEVSGAVSGGMVGNAGTGVLMVICCNTGDITASNGPAGGICGSYVSPVIENGYNTGRIESSAGASSGGIVGVVTGGTGNGAIVNVYNTGTVSGGEFRGPIFGNSQNEGPSVTNSYYLRGSGDYTVQNGTERSSAELSKESTYTDWNFTDIWETIPDAYPTLRAFNTPVVINPIDDMTVEHGTYLEFVVTPDVDCVISVIGAPWLSVSGNTIFGTSPSFDGLYGLKITVSRPGYTSSYVDVMVNVVVSEYLVTASKTDGGKVSPSTQNVIHGNNCTVIFTPNIGFHISKILVDGVPDEDAVVAGSYTFEDVRSDHNVHVEFKRNVYVIESSSDGKGKITVSGTLEHGSVAVVSFIPDYGHKILTVRIDNIPSESVKASGSYTFTDLRGPHSVYAEFVPDLHDITVTHTLGGSIEGDRAVMHGDPATFRVNPDEGYRIVSITVDGEDVGTDDSYTFPEITEPHSVHVEFALKEYVIRITYSGNGGSDHPEINTVKHGSSISVTFTPGTGYLISSVEIDGIQQDLSGTYSITDIDSDRTVHAVFTIIMFDFDIVAGEGGSISPSSKKFEWGSDAEFEFIPGDGFEIAEVRVDGSSLGICNAYMISNILEEHSIYAVFKKKVYMVTVTHSDGGTVNGVREVTHGDFRVFTMIPNEGYCVSSLTLDDEAVDPNGPIVFSSVTGPHSIHAEFILKEYAVHVTHSGNGGSDRSGVNMVKHGSDITVSFIPELGHRISKIDIDGFSQDIVSTHVLRNVTSEHSVHAVFVIITFTMTVEYNDGGDVSPNSHIVEWGSDAEFVFTVSEGYEICDVTVDGSSTDVCDRYHIEDIREDHTISVTFGRIVYVITLYVEKPEEGWDETEFFIEHGDDHEIILEHEKKYRIREITVDGSTVSIVGRYVFTSVDRGHVVSVILELVSYSIMISAVGNGSVEPSGTIQVVHGYDQYLGFTPDAGHRVARVNVNGSEIETADTNHILRTVEEDMVIAVEFDAILYLLSVNIDGNGNSTYLGDTYVRHGESRTVIFAPEYGHGLKSITLDGVDVTNFYKDGKLTIQMVKDHVISATFVNVREDVSDAMYIMIGVGLLAAAVLAYSVVSFTKSRRPKKRKR